MDPEHVQAHGCCDKISFLVYHGGVRDEGLGERRLDGCGDCGDRRQFAAPIHLIP